MPDLIARPRVHRPSSLGRLALLLVCAIALFAAACGGDDAASPSTTASTSAPTGSDEPEYGGGHGAHNMGIEPGTVEDVAALGPGPSVGDRWEIPVGLNVCGRFIEAPTGGPVGGVTSAAGGTAVIEPVEGSDAPTLGDYAEAAGVTLRTGEIGLPSGVVPNAIELGEEDLSLDGATFRTGEECGTTRAEVQVWVYSAEDVSTGERVLTVTTDPQEVPFVEDGMALVIAFTPESSLPTLPPSAQIRPG